MKLGAFGLLFGGLVLTALVSLTLGRYDFAPLSSLTQLWWSLTSQDGEVNQLLVNIMLDVRLPRILAAVLIGAALAVAGTAFQALFMNPLVSPGVLGVLSGSAFGASLGILLFDSVWMMQLLSFGFGLLAVFIALMLAKGELRNNLTILVLGG